MACSYRSITGRGSARNVRAEGARPRGERPGQRADDRAVGMDGERIARADRDDPAAEAARPRHEVRADARPDELDEDREPVVGEQREIEHPVVEHRVRRDREAPRVVRRVGHDALEGPALVTAAVDVEDEPCAPPAEHRPERAGVIAEAGQRPLQLDFGERPFWLLESPRPLAEIGAVPHHDGPLELLVGPERIESGWWDGDDVARDYFVARMQNEALVWIYREWRGEGGWYLHGVFA